jgi:glycosyltransferase involved in cell wall biosynthesis
MIAGLVSVIIPAYNAAGFLSDAIDSALAQQYPHLEVVVVDDGSIDDPCEVASRYGDRVRCVRQDNAGPAAARNRGIRMAGGEFLAFLDADDLWPAGKLQIQMARFADDPALDVVAGRIQYVRLDGAAELELRFEDTRNTVTHVHLGSAVCRRRAFDRVGFFDESLRFSEDHDWYLRAREEGLSIVVLREITLLYRLHGSNMTRNATSQQLGLARVLKKSLERRRLKSGGTAENLRPWSAFDERRDRGD